MSNGNGKFTVFYDAKYTAVFIMNPETLVQQQ